MKPLRRRTHALSRIRKRHAYSIDEVAKLLPVSKGTVHHWLKSGLNTTDRKRPYLIHGGDLFDFLKGRQQARKQTCAINEMFCLPCRAPRMPYGLMVDVTFRNQATAQISGLCCKCETRINRISSLAKLTGMLKAFDQVTLLNPRLIERLPPSLNCYLEKDT